MIYEVLILILPFVTSPYVARVIGAEGLGVFSDDVDWVRNNVHFPVEVYYESGNDPVNKTPILLVTLNR